MQVQILPRSLFSPPILGLKHLALRVVPCDHGEFWVVNLFEALASGAGDAHQQTKQTNSKPKQSK